MSKVKFKFILNSGETFECIEEMSAEMFMTTVKTIKISMRDNISGMLCFEDCCVRLSECAVVEWEEIS